MRRHKLLHGGKLSHGLELPGSLPVLLLLLQESVMQTAACGSLLQVAVSPVVSGMIASCQKRKTLLRLSSQTRCQRVRAAALQRIHQQTAALTTWHFTPAGAWAPAHPHRSDKHTFNMATMCIHTCLHAPCHMPNGHVMEQKGFRSAVWP